MPCIHGLDENNCPTCRLTWASLPKSPLNTESMQNNFLKPEHLLFKQDYNNKQELIKNITLKKSPLTPESISKPNLITDLPSFENKMFSERLNEIDLSKSDKFGITKKELLGSPELRYYREE